MRKISTIVAAVLILTLAGAASAQVRGKGRIQGAVIDKATRKPVADAKVTVAMHDGSTAPIVAKTNAKGRWSALGLIGGQWNVDIEAPGYTTSRGSVNVSEMQMLPLITTELVPEVKAQPEPAAGPSMQAVPEAAINAINEAQALLKATENVEESARKAAALIETALPQIPDDSPERHEVRLQIHQVLAQAYYKGGDLPKAITALNTVYAADPSNTANALLLTNLYLENSQLDKGRQLLAAIPATAVTDPTVYLNIGILFMNKNNPADAVTYFGKAIDLDMTRHEGYYYRGLANLQMKKTAEAKADFEKVVSIAPASTEASDAKQMLAGMK